MRFVHYSDDQDLSLDKLYSVNQFALSDKGVSYFKPLGLWFSDDDESENWREWCEEEGLDPERLEYAYQAELDLSKVLHIRTEKELRDFHRKYAEKVEVLSWSMLIDWQKVAQDYKGIIISPYQWDMRLDGEVRWYYGWDVACACIWDMSAIKSFEKIKGK